ncbi:MAG: RNA polymerase subunit sigma-24 [Nocardioides sp.]|nr:RNA polymerase subunit sigma-24 [Nocardioidaceae bacterium]MCB8955582.1 RNA polymerase subunit sigma-24 [Nocardioides sp.]
MADDRLEELVRDLTPRVLGALVRRGADFASAEDAVQEALVEAVRRWPDAMPEDPAGWLVTVAWRKLVDAGRSETARRAREERVADEPAPGPAEEGDDTLLLLFLCCHPALTPASAVPLTLRAVGGLTTRQIAGAFLVPEPTMAQRISRAKRTVADAGVGPPGDLRAVLQVLYLVFNEGYTGDVDLAAEAIRLTRMLAAASDEPEVGGLLALMLLHHARRAARWTDEGALVPLEEQDRSRWDTRLVAEGVDVLQTALAQDRLGEYQAQAAIAALHCDAPSAAETDWPQVLEWYDELLALTGSPVVALNRAVVVGEVDGPLAGLAALRAVPPDVPRRTAVQAWLTERAGDRPAAHALYAAAASQAGNLAERDHLVRQAARLHGSG